MLVVGRCGVPSIAWSLYDDSNCNPSFLFLSKERVGGMRIG